MKVENQNPNEDSYENIRITCSECPTAFLNLVSLQESSSAS